MKWITNLLFLVCGAVAIWEQSKPNPNKFLMIFCMFIFGIGLYRLMKKIPSKDENNHDE